MALERRASAREPLSLKVQLADGTPASTRDISSGGLYLIVPPEAEVPPWFSMEFEVPMAGLKFVAAGEVVRNEAASGHTGLGVRLHGARLVPTPVSFAD